MASRWVMNRAGLINFWYYDHEIFHFQDGKLLLRGTNGSGKSVTMQSFLPVLLDGKKSPDRLDPFGSKARRMEDYLLGEKEVVDRDERTGYLFIEYKKAGTEQYITTGIGMQAKRNKGIKSWYFIVTDNRRIGGELHLTGKHAGEEVPFSAKELENRIGQGGYVVRTQREYMELVNRYVFGFQNIDAYEDLIKLLIQLRSPKLSKDFKPTVIYEILESALPPLTDDELRHLSDTIENMDQTAQQLEQLEREHESMERLVVSYDHYNKYMIAERALRFIEAEEKWKKAEKNLTNLNNQYEEYNKEILELTENLQFFKQQKSVAEEEKSSLQTHEVWSLEEDKGKKEAEAKALLKEIEQLQRKWQERNGKLSSKWKEKENAELVLHKNQQQVKEIFEELALDAEEASFHEHQVNMDDYKRMKDHSFHFSNWLKEAKEHQELLVKLEKLAEDVNRQEGEYVRLQQESSEKKKVVDVHRKELDHLQQWFETEQQELESKVFQWMEELPKLHYSPQHRQEIARGIQGLYEKNRFDPVMDKLLSEIHSYGAEVKKDLAITKDMRQKKLKEIEETEAELHRIKTQKMLEPERASGTKEHRSKLIENNVPFLPFYAAVEFRDGVNDEQKERIESALKKTGLLDSLITNRSLIPEQDSVLLPEPQLLGYTLADFLMPDIEEDSPITKELVDEVLRSISLEKNASGFSIDADGSYSIGCLVGHAPMEGASKYIGRTSRKRHQREQILFWTEKLKAQEEELSTLQGDIQRLEEELQQVEGWKQTIPHDGELRELQEQIVTKRQELKGEQELLRRIDEHWKMVHEKLVMVKKELRELGIHLNITLTHEDIKCALKAAGSYLDFLHQLEKLAERIRFIESRVQSLQTDIEEIAEDLNSIKGEQNSKESLVSKLKALIQSIEQQLQLKGIEEVRIRIREVQQLLNEAENQITYIHQTLPRTERDQEKCEEQMDEMKTELHFWQNMSTAWNNLLEKEKERDFLQLDDENPESIIEQFQPILTKYDRSKLLEQLTKAYFNEQPHLTEYRMFEHTEDVELPGWFLEDFGDRYEPFKNEFRQLITRRLIGMEYRGQRVNPYYVFSSLKKELEEQKGWLDEQDRQLYEDIIVNSVGVMLRNRIKRAQDWVKEMDRIMAERDSSSGLIFSIAWKPLTAESEQEMDTSDLIQLLQRNSKFLNEEDLNRITKHFQSRIAKAKELIQLRNEGSTLHQVLKEVLDYRKWFTFVLSFSRVNEPKRELTNNAFFKFSGGEKAMAMYIPLFTAAYSRYKEAGEMAPYIISLDEAFAGVDENNIRDMFEVVEELGFDYIMNSQALWGDYDTISSLSICELVRPKNADYVTVIRYEWDGKQRTLVLEDESMNEELVPNE